MEENSGEIRHGVGGLDEFFQGGHDRGTCKEFAEEIDFAAEFFVRDGLDEFFRGGSRGAVELGGLSGRGARDAQGFTFGSELRDQADGLGACGVDAAASQQKIADEGVAEIALQARDAAEAGDEAEAQLGKCEARHFIGHDDVASEGEFEAAAEAHTVNGSDGREWRGVDGIEGGVNAF